MNMVTYADLKNWASSRASQEQLPEFIRSLIRNSVDDIQGLDFPGSDAIWLPGKDGYIFAPNGNDRVPQGISVWECGTNDGIGGKANGDYEKRSNIEEPLANAARLPVEAERRDATFVFVTPYAWRDKDSWVVERKKEGIWKDIRVIDGSQLQEWIEDCPAISLKISKALRLTPPEGLQIPEDAWKQWSHLTDPPIPQGLALVGRESSTKELIRRLLDVPSVISVKADSSREAYGFVLDAINSIDDKVTSDAIVPRLICVRDEGIASSLRNRKNQVILLEQAKGPVSAALIDRGTHLIVPAGNDIQTRENTIELERQNQRDLVNVLSNQGVDLGKAEAMSSECSGLLTVYLRRNAVVGLPPPTWSGRSESKVLLPALFAGRWDRRSEFDRSILCTLFDEEDYNTVEDLLYEFCDGEDPALQRIDSVWAFRAPLDAFEVLARHITAKQIDRFKEAFGLVFSLIDFKLDLPPEERPYHVHDIQKDPSSWLRKGMAEAVLLIAARGQEAGLEIGEDAEAVSNSIVAGIPDLSENWKALVSLQDQYPLLMEATPIPLLSSLEKFLLEADRDDVLAIFTEGQAGLGHGPLLTGVLWGLETLVWSSEYFERVVKVLTKLSEVDPGGQWMNRPINTLRDVFLSWHPGTNVTIEKKIGSVRSMISTSPEVAWKLLEGILPTGRKSFATQTHRPKWRYFGELPEGSRTWLQIHEYEDQLAELSISSVVYDTDNWSLLLQILPRVSESRRLSVIARLGDIVDALTSEKDRTALWIQLDEYINARHSSLPDLDAIGEAAWNKLIEIKDALTPSDKVIENLWLFDSWLPLRVADGEDWRETEQKTQNLRETAVLEVFNQQGLDGIICLAERSELQQFVAGAVKSLQKELEFCLDLQREVLSKGAPLAVFSSAVSSQALELHDNSWLEAVKGFHGSIEVGSDTFAALLANWPQVSETWKFVEGFGAEMWRIYWQNFRIYIFDEKAVDPEFQISNLLEVGRSCDVLSSLGMSARNVGSDVMLKVFDRAMDDLFAASSTEETRRLLPRFDSIESFFDKLIQRSDVDREDIARREYRALSLMRSVPERKLVLHSIMANDPKFFVDVVCDSFMPRNRDRTDVVEATPEEQARARSGYQLLSSMHTIPGAGEEGQIDQDHLRSWIGSVRQLAKDADREVITELQIGQILAHSQIDETDEAWPHATIRRVIEEMASVDLLSGLRTERHNMRGVVTKSMGEGGKQERELAEEYRQWSQVCLSEWPKTAGALKALADDYERDGERADIRAKQTEIE